MICSHAFLGVPNSNYLWCTLCGTLRESHTSAAQWTPRYLELVGEGEAPLTYEEKMYCAQDQKIMAIKLVRERTRLGLKEAKDVVEAYMRKNPPAPRKPPSSEICVGCNGDFSGDVMRNGDSNYCTACSGH